MSLSSVPYFFASCSGKTSNLRNPRCLIEGPGSFDESEAAAQATAEGWALGPKSYCPAHKDQAPAPSPDGDPATTTPARKSRRKPTPELGLEYPQEGGDQ